ncbi:hypothetical protein DAPPUDRAFT_104329 [Daphnia pulex]|uniref:Spen paralogue and orthologue SPOC C-terminal domain-containing protein n=1 Tax=Daphnia pulex TaxID=6669 RepID=E9GLY1_DAPPU|nr:hypothetical protein DAPPUDRAFT_104329 [Daphnia pulex]|eukprot:EFX79610.1 hypothetical protein DAPPUDRAFT_104329 [Daphnia pulex]
MAAFEATNSCIPRCSIPRCNKLNEEPSLSSNTKSDIVMDKLGIFARFKVVIIYYCHTPTTPPTGWTTPLINTGGPRFDDCDSVSDGLASSTPRVGSSSSAVSSGEDWVEAVELKSSERNAAVKARITSSALKNYDWESVWKGSVTYKDLKFRVAMEVFDVNKPTDFMKSVMPLSLEVVGNIDNPEKVWNYLKRVKETIDTEVIFLQCSPTSYADWNLYLKFCKACQDMGIAVLGGVPSPVKNLYLFPILKGRPIPKELNRASSLLLGILVMRKGQHKLYENSRPQNVIPTDKKTGPSSSNQPLNRAVANNIRQQVQQEQGILRVNPIKTKPESSKLEATPSKVAKTTNSEPTTRALARFALKEAMWGSCQWKKDLVTDEANVKQIAAEIEESLFAFLNKDVGPKDLGRGILGLVGLEEKMETNEIRLLSSIDGFGDE